MIKLPQFTADACLEKNTFNNFSPMSASYAEVISPALIRVPTNPGGGLGCYYQCLLNGANKSMCKFFCDIIESDLWVLRW